MKKTTISSSEKETKKIASDSALQIINSRPKKAVIVALSGDLGAGKTVFTKGFLASLGVKTRVTSPTFVVFKRYAVPPRRAFGETGKKRNFDSVYHFDCYRIKDPQELKTLGFKDICANPRNIVLIEWPENAGRLSPTLRVSIDHLPEENARWITISESK